MIDKITFMHDEKLCKYFCEIGYCCYMSKTKKPMINHYLDDHYLTLNEKDKYFGRQKQIHERRKFIFNCIDNSKFLPKIKFKRIKDGYKCCKCDFTHTQELNCKIHYMFDHKHVDNLDFNEIYSDKEADFIDNKKIEVLRRLISYQTCKFRDENVTEDSCCEICNDPSNLQIDHYPDPFIKIRTEFFNNEELRDLSVIKNKTQISLSYNLIKNGKDCTDDWIKFHEQQSKYRILCADCNRLNYTYGFGSDIEHVEINSKEHYKTHTIRRNRKKKPERMYPSIEALCFPKTEMCGKLRSVKRVIPMTSFDKKYNYKCDVLSYFK